MWSTFSDGRSINAELYSKQPEWVNEVLVHIYPALGNRKRIFLLDNALPHIIIITLNRTEELDGLELLIKAA